ncbi:hypothetical protein BH11PLA1_BH11PLA1_05370 [soil metagenome]
MSVGRAGQSGSTVKRKSPRVGGARVAFAAAASARKPGAAAIRARDEYSRLEFYELTVQKPAALIPLLRAIHGAEPTLLAEDFCGGAALSRAWMEAVPGARAVAADLDRACLAHARAAWKEALKAQRGVSSRPRAAGALTLVRADVLGSPLLKDQPADVLFVGNFSIGEVHERGALVAYLKRCHARLAPRRGVLVCDTYGGETAFARGSVTRVHPGPAADPALRIRYTWEQRAADPLTGRVVNAIHFRTLRAGEVVQEITDAFVYRWRLWSVPELRDAMMEAGFKRTEVFAQLIDAEDSEGRAYARPIEDAAEVDETFIVCVAGRTG